VPLQQLPGVPFEVLKALSGIPGLGEIGDPEDASEPIFDGIYVGGFGYFYQQAPPGSPDRTGAGSS
jgi:hypothetical protein